MTPLFFKIGPYDISSLECYRDLLNKVYNNDSFKPNIPKEEYLNGIRFAVINYARIKGYQKEWTDIAKKQVFYVSTNSPDFTYWLGIKLSLIEPFEIPLVLDELMKKSNKPNNQFVNETEHYVLNDIIKTLICHDCIDQKTAISNWIREQRKFVNENEPDLPLQLGDPPNLTYNQENVPFIEDFIDTFVGSSMAKLTDSTEKKSTVFDDRIKTELSNVEIRKYFMQLNTLNRKGELILNEQNIETLIASNFQGFPKKKRKLLTANVSKQALMKFVYHFYLNVDGESYAGRQMEYSSFLVMNFESFKNDLPENVSKKMAGANPRYYPFS